jgi:hypothetical protein
MPLDTIPLSQCYTIGIHRVSLPFLQAGGFPALMGPVSAYRLCLLQS